MTLLGCVNVYVNELLIYNVGVVVNLIGKPAV